MGGKGWLGEQEDLKERQTAKEKQKKRPFKLENIFIFRPAGSANSI